MAPAAFGTIAQAAELALNYPVDGYELLERLDRYQNARFGTSGEDLQQLTDIALSLGYVNGVTVALAQSDICLGAGTQDTHVYLAVKAYLQQNTQDLAKHPYQLVRAALLKAFPCK